VEGKRPILPKVQLSDGEVDFNYARGFLPNPQDVLLINIVGRHIFILIEFRKETE